MSISANYPALRPALLLDFANSQQLDPRVTFSRSTTAPYYDGKTSVLAEQNLLTYSQDFSNAIWVKAYSTVTASATTAPDGTTTGQKLIGTAVTNSHSVNQSGLLASTQYSYSIYAKSADYTNLQLYNDGVGNFNATFDLTAGTTVAVTGCTSTITSIGSGWYRCTATHTTPASGAKICVQGFPTGASASNFGNPFTGDGTSGIYIWGAQLEQRSSVTAYNATTTSAITNYIPQLLTAPINAPRFDFNPTTGESLGLLIEQSSTNLLIYSEQLDNTNFWLTGSNTAVLANQVVAPDGNITGDQITVTSASNSLRSIDVTVTANTTYTFSQFVKRGTSTDLLWSVYNTSAAASLVAPVSYYSQTTATGWARCTLTFTTPVGCTLIRIFPVNNNAVGTVFIWGAQLEALAFPTSYIPTTSAQVTRASDNTSMTGTNFSSWFNQGQGTFYVESWFLSPVSGYPSPYSINDGTNNNRIQAYVNNSLTSLGGDITLGFVSQANVLATVPSMTSYVKSAFSFQSKVVNFAGAGVAGTTNTTANIPNGLNKLSIGTNAAGTAFSIYIKKIAYYPKALSSAEIQEMTS